MSRRGETVGESGKFEGRCCLSHLLRIDFKQGLSRGCLCSGSRGTRYALVLTLKREREYGRECPHNRFCLQLWGCANRGCPNRLAPKRAYATLGSSIFVQIWYAAFLLWMFWY